MKIPGMTPEKSLTGPTRAEIFASVGEELPRTEDENKEIMEGHLAEHKKRVFKRIEPIKKEFMPKYERHEPAARDSTAIKAAKECFRKYFFSTVLGFRVGKGPAPMYFPFGSGYHLFRELLEKEYKKYQNVLDCDKCLEPSWKEVLAKWPGNSVPGSNKWDYLTKDYLLLSCLTGFNFWKAEKIKGTFEILATEQPFEVVLPNGKTSGGRADQIVRWNGKPWGRDFKTTGKTPQWYERSALDPVDQFFRYTHGESGLLGERIEGQIVEVLFHKKATKNDKGKPFIRSFIVSHTPSQIDRWEREQEVIERQIDICREEDVWPACETFCSWCDYHNVCKMGTERGMQAKLEQGWIQRHWDYKNIDNSAG